MNIGKRVMKGSRDITAVVAVLALLGACASLPALDEVRTVSLGTDFRSYRGLAVDVDGNPEYRPGHMAAEAFEGASGCGLCVLGAIITAPLAATVGAVITTTETLPKEQAHELNRVSANVTAGLNLTARFAKAMREGASRQGIVLTGRRADARLNIVMTRFRWDVSVGNNVAIRIDFKVTGFADGKRGHRNITFTSERRKAPEWISDSGKRIRQELLTIMDEASQTIWQQVLDRDEQTRTKVII